MNLYRFHNLFLLVQLLPQSLIQFTSAAPCTVCLNGTTPTNDTATVDFLNNTLNCGSIDTVLAALNSTDQSCTYAQSTLGQVCGCPSSSNNTNSSSNVQMCSLCPINGTSPTNTDLILPFLGQNFTCQAIDSSLKAAVSASDPNCALARTNVAPLCGCPGSYYTNSNTGGMCPGICDVMAYPNRTVPPVMGLTLTCSQANLLLKSLPASDEYCKTIPIIAGQYCGCLNAPPSCTPCYGNAVPPDYSKTFTLGGSTISCAEYAIATAIASVDNTTGLVNQTLCNSYQGGGSLFCGCPRPPTFCSLCSSGQKTNATASYISPYTLQSTTCGESELTYNFATNSCPAILFVSNFTGEQSKCCVKSASSRFSSTIGWAASATLFSFMAFFFM